MNLVLVKNDAKILREKCEDVAVVNDIIKEILDNMEMFCKRTARPRISSLAANQVGINKRLIVIIDNYRVLKLVNPKIVEEKGLQTSFESCASVSINNGFCGGFVDRPAFIKVEALDLNGKKIEIEAKDILAIMLCHEIDHLEGILFTDKLEGELYNFKTYEERTKFKEEHPIIEKAK